MKIQILLRYEFKIFGDYFSQLKALGKVKAIDKDDTFKNEMKYKIIDEERIDCSEIENKKNNCLKGNVSFQRFLIVKKDF